MAGLYFALYSIKISISLMFNILRFIAKFLNFRPCVNFCQCHLIIQNLCLQISDILMISVFKEDIFITMLFIVMFIVHLYPADI